MPSDLAPTPSTADPATSGAASRAAYVVLGMHRSGTSAATQLLAFAGAQLPDNVMPGDEHNEKGYFEPWRIAIFNDQRLRAGGGAWDDPFVHPYAEAPDEADWRARAQDLFREEYGEARYPLLKDPRVSVLMPLWRPLLEAEGLAVRCVIPVRHPLAVAGSLARRDEFPPVKSVLLWITYMLGAETGSRGLPRAFVDYDGLLSDWRSEVARLEDALGAPLPRMNAYAAARIDGFLSKDLRHNAGEGDLTALGPVGVAARDMLAWFRAAAQGAAPDRAPLDAATALLAEMKLQMGPFVSPVTRALDIARAKLDDARREREHRAQAEDHLAAEVLRLQAEQRAFEAELDRFLARG